MLSVHRDSADAPWSWRDAFRTSAINGEAGPRMDSPILKITKLEAAQRQLAEAVRLFFEQRDIVCVHTLAGAAVRVLSDLAAHRGVANPIRDSDRIRPERRKEFLGVLNAAQNFFKHADKDPHAVFEFRLGATP